MAYPLPKLTKSLQDYLFLQPVHPNHIHPNFPYSLNRNRGISDHQFLEQLYFEARDIVLEVHGVRVGYSKDGEDDEEGLAVLSLSRLAEAHRFLISCYLKCVAIVLVSVPAVAGDKLVEGRYEPALAPGVCEVETLEVVHKGVGSEDLESRDLSTIVFHTGRIELSAGSVGDYLLPASGGALLGADSRGLVVVALDGEDEVGPALPHLVVQCLIVGQLLQVEDVLPDVTAEHCQNQVDHNTTRSSADSSSNLQELTHSNCHHHYSCDQQDVAHQNCPVFGGCHCNWLIFLEGKARIQGIIVEGVEASQLLKEVLAGCCHHRVQGLSVHRVWGKLRGRAVCIHWVWSQSISLRRSIERIGSGVLRVHRRRGWWVLREHVDIRHGDVWRVGVGVSGRAYFVIGEGGVVK